jgi:molybdate transport system substrate-binding protein
MRGLILAIALLWAGCARAEVTVFAAASLTEAMQDIAAVWTKAGHAAPKLVFASSSTLARQIEAGAPAQVFASADLQWADYLDQKGLLAPGTRRNLLGNALVLVVPKAQARSIAIGPGLDIAALLGRDGRLAVGDPAHVPAGLYAEQAFRALGLWAVLEPRLARAQDVRGALMLVSRGEAPAGVVYATDAAADPGVAIAGRFPATSVPPIIYPFALTKTGDSAEPRAFLDFLSQPQAQAIFAARGFATE